jgi:cytochrome P450
VDFEARNFKDPEQFKPERWLDVTRNEPHNLEAFIPFNYGLGVCIGKQIALQNMKYVWLVVSILSLMITHISELGS